MLRQVVVIFAYYPPLLFSFPFGRKDQIIGQKVKNVSKLSAFEMTQMHDWNRTENDVKPH